MNDLTTSERREFEELQRAWVKGHDCGGRPDCPLVQRLDDLNRRVNERVERERWARVGAIMQFFQMKGDER